MLRTYALMVFGVLLFSAAGSTLVMALFPDSEVVLVFVPFIVLYTTLLVASWLIFTVVGSVKARRSQTD